MLGSASPFVFAVALSLPGMSGAEAPTLQEAFGVWRCEARYEDGDSRITWFNFGRNGAQEWLMPPGQPSGWSEAFSWRREAEGLDWASRSGDLHYRGRATDSAIEGALFYDDAHSELAGDFSCERSEDVPATVLNAESAELDPPPVGQNSNRQAPKPRPTPKRMVAPAYPEQALLQEVEGRVIVCFNVDTRGRVFEPVVIESTNAVFNAPVLKALARSRYEPARDDGKAVTSHSCRIFKFWLN